MLALDTDHLTALGYLGPLGRRLLQRLSASEEEIATTAISVDEQLSGLLAAIHGCRDPEEQIPSYAELVERLDFLARFRVLRWDASSVARFRELKAQRVRCGTMDLKIASIALTHDATLLTRNTMDFAKVPGLRFANWLD